MSIVVKMLNFFKTSDFIAELIYFIQSKHKHLIRYYELYSSSTNCFELIKDIVYISYQQILGTELNKYYKLTFFL